MTFRIEALSPEPFAHLFLCDDDTLRRHRARRMVVDANPGTPCRVSLEDAQVGETVVLVNHTHLTPGSPYHGTHAIFVREGVAQAHPAPGVVPDVIRSRLISLRAFDADGMMTSADVADGDGVAERLDATFADPSVVHVDLHNAKPGCFAARAVRA
ncbi:DUF1203 domain-containing protein [Jannaschia sp. LMIT008]|uniref:DUF1203 domain-containing protein n=1 Tax=Jannaschia maritima TaxID=3032585 RepID=UPI002811FA5B|nr:DUF1203 domain-containing protein [Jannaschia sp. LMIT008]